MKSIVALNRQVDDSKEVELLIAELTEREEQSCSGNGCPVNVCPVNICPLDDFKII